MMEKACIHGGLGEEVMVIETHSIPGSMQVSEVNDVVEVEVEAGLIMVLKLPSRCSKMLSQLFRMGPD